MFCFKLLHHIEGDPFWFLGFSSMNLQYTTYLVCMLPEDVIKHMFVVQTNSHIFTMMFQQTCSPQIISLGVFTEVNKLLQPRKSGVMEFMTWCLQQFSEAAHVCFLCHCISTLKEKEIHKIRNVYLIQLGWDNINTRYLRINFKGMSLSHCVNNIYALQFPGVGCSLLTDKMTLKLLWGSKGWGNNEENFL